MREILAQQAAGSGQQAARTAAGSGQLNTAVWKLATGNWQQAAGSGSHCHAAPGLRGPAYARAPSPEPRAPSPERETPQQAEVIDLMTRLRASLEGKSAKSAPAHHARRTTTTTKKTARGKRHAA